MGVPSPVIWPVVEPLKYYCFNIDWYAADPDDPCGDEHFINNVNCVEAGSAFINWRNNGGACVSGNLVCSQPAPGTHRILTMHGPFDTGPEAEAFCGI